MNQKENKKKKSIDRNGNLNLNYFNFNSFIFSYFEDIKSIFKNSKYLLFLLFEKTLFKKTPLTHIHIVYLYLIASSK